MEEAEEARNLFLDNGHTMIELPDEEYNRWKDVSMSCVDAILLHLDASGIPATAIAADIIRLRSS